MGKLTTTATQRTDLALIATTPQLLASLGVNFRPDLPAGVDQGQWGRSYAAAIGQHPANVLERTQQIIIASRSYQTFPQPAEIIGAILNAYGQLGVPMSLDAVRLQDLRQSSDRYTAGADGRRRFLSGLKLGVIKFHALTGHQGNQVLDEIEIATVEHVEQAFIDVSRDVDKLDEIAIGDLIRRIANRSDAIAALATFGPVEAQCGGPIAEHGEIEFSSRWVALSQAFVGGLIAKHQALRFPSNVWHYSHGRPEPEPTDGNAWERLQSLFWQHCHEANPRRYGRGLQADFEGRFIAAVAASIPDLERERADRIASRTAWAEAKLRAA
jgi:hypothetical protein